MTVKIQESWEKELKSEFNQQYFKDLVSFVKLEYQQEVVYPPGKEIFAALDCCPFDEVKVVILGQDPYHGPNQANGLCFSVSSGVRIPPSLKNIFKEIKSDLNIEKAVSGDLTDWANQGVLLLNSTLTVRQNSPGSHQNQGWEQFTDSVVKVLSQKRSNLVFLLWGAYAQRKGEVIDDSKHLVLKSPHPSPFSANRGFLGNRHFSRTNEYLISQGLNPISW